jgi:hypothetical protein
MLGPHGNPIGRFNMLDQGHWGWFVVRGGSLRRLHHQRRNFSEDSSLFALLVNACEGPRNGDKRTTLLCNGAFLRKTRDRQKPAYPERKARGHQKHAYPDSPQGLVSHRGSRHRVRRRRPRSRMFSQYRPNGKRNGRRSRHDRCRHPRIPVRNAILHPRLWLRSCDGYRRIYPRPAHRFGNAVMLASTGLGLAHRHGFLHGAQKRRSSTYHLRRRFALVPYAGELERLGTRIAILETNVAIVAPLSTRHILKLYALRIVCRRTILRTDSGRLVHYQVEIDGRRSVGCALHVVRERVLRASG